MKTIKIKLAFYDWQRGGHSVYNTELGIELSAGQFHSGTTFDGTIEVDEDEAMEIKMAIDAGLIPVFSVVEHEDSEQ